MCERKRDFHLPTTIFFSNIVSFQWGKEPAVEIRCPRSSEVFTVFEMRNILLNKNIVCKHTAFWGSIYLSSKLWVIKWFTRQPLLFKACTILLLNKNPILSILQDYSSEHTRLLPPLTLKLHDRTVFSVPLAQNTRH